MEWMLNPAQIEFRDTLRRGLIAKFRRMPPAKRRGLTEIILIICSSVWQKAVITLPACPRNMAAWAQIWSLS